jgi:hypothetical protein
MDINNIQCSDCQCSFSSCTHTRKLLMCRGKLVNNCKSCIYIYHYIVCYILRQKRSLRVAAEHVSTSIHISSKVVRLVGQIAAGPRQHSHYWLQASLCSRT